MKKLLVRVVSSQKNTFWYSDCIGSIFEVVDEGRCYNTIKMMSKISGSLLKISGSIDFYKNGSLNGCLIQKSDVTIYKNIDRQKKLKKIWKSKLSV